MIRHVSRLADQPDHVVEAESHAAAHFQRLGHSTCHVQKVSLGSVCFVSDTSHASTSHEKTPGLRVIERSEHCCIFDGGAGALFEPWGKGCAPPPADRHLGKDQCSLAFWSRISTYPFKP